MTAVTCLDPGELRRLIEEPVGPIRAGEIEAHVEADPPGQDQLERLTVRRAWHRDDRATRKASSLDGQAPDAADTEAGGGTTALIRWILQTPSGATTAGRGEAGAAAGDSDDEPPGSTDLEPADVHAADRKSVGLSSPTRIGFRCRRGLRPPTGS